MVKKAIFNIVDRLSLQTNKHHNLYAKTQWWTREQLEDFQLMHLSQLGKIWGLEIESWGDFYSLPLTTKEDIKGFRPKKGQSYHIHRTSGSTGYPLEIYLPKDNLGIKEGMFRRHWDWIGRKDELIVRWLSGKPQFAWHDLWRNVKPFNYRDITDKKIDWIVRNRPPFMHATVFTPREIIRRLEQRGEAGVLKSMTLWWTGENTQTHKEDVAKYFKDIYEGYGLAELPGIATECPYHRLHVNMETAIVEEIDGEIVVTNPYNSITPIIRYRTGDRGNIKQSDCPCGRKLDILYDLDGKSVDYYNGPEVRTPIDWLIVSPISKHFLDIIETWRAEANPKEGKFILEVIWRGKGEFERVEWYRQWVQEETGLECEIRTRKGPFQGKKLLAVK